MNTQRFTIKSQELLADMQDLASSYGHQEIKDLHLLQAMLSSGRRTDLTCLGKTGGLHSQSEKRSRKCPEQAA